MSYNTYEKYKDSGIEWIGEIPEHWEVKKIKSKCYVKARVGWKGLKSDEFLREGFAFLITGSDFKNDSVNWSECYHIGADRYEDDPFIQLKENDLLITKDGTIGKLAIVKNLTKPACLNSGIFVVRPLNNDISTEFLYWILKSKSFKQFNEFTSYGSTIQHLYQNVFVEFSFQFPTLAEQTKIANFLDQKTAEIDELIADKQRLLALYEEEKTAIINQAVTKGINPDAPMKDSGIEWLGEIPAHWEVKKLKNLVSKIGSGVTPSGGSTVYLKSGIPLLRSQNIHFDGLKLEDVAYISEEIDESMKNSRIQAKDVLLNITGASIGRCYYLPDDFEYGNVNQHVCILRPKIDKIDTKYLYFLMRSELGQLQIALQQTGANREGLNFEQLRNFLFCIPSVKEQKNIIRELENETDKVNTKITRTQKLIDLLTEYKTALISEVVTGKIKVSN